MAGKRVLMRRPQGASAELAAVTEINVVRVWEPNPIPGEPPVEWVLLTSEPIDTEKQLCQIVDWYRDYSSPKAVVTPAELASTVTAATRRP